MRSITLVTMMLAVLPCLVARADEAPERQWTIGYAEAEITPGVGQVQMSGFGRERYAKGTLTPLLTQTIALRDRDGQTGVIITADIAGFGRVMTEAIRRSIARKHDMPAENVILAPSHTHWGPATRFHATFACGAPNVWYMGFLEDKILGNVDAALENLAPGTIEYGSIDFRDIGCNRRLPKEGKITWGPYREGSFDGHTPILRVKRSAKPQQLLVIGHACHPTSSGGIEKWSPDYPGAMRDCLAAKLPHTKALFVQGCGGDAKVVHEDPESGKLAFSADPERSKAAGEKLAQAVLRHLEKGRMIPLAGQLACSLASGQLSYGERWSREELEEQAYFGSRKRYYAWVARQFLALPDHSESYRYDVQIWKLGNQLTIFGMEGEVCSPWGPMLRSMATTEQAMVVGYVSNVDAYIPDKRIVREGGYEGGEAQKFFLPGPFTEKIESEIKPIVAKALLDCASDSPAGEQVAPDETVKVVFSHIGIVTNEKKPGERFVPATRVWVTDFQKHPHHVEWLRFEPDSPTTGPVRELPHVAYEVNSIKVAAKGMKELLAPFDAGIAVVGFYQTDDGAVVEFMEMKEKK